MHLKAGLIEISAENDARKCRSFVLNTILLGSIGLTFIALAFMTFRYLQGKQAGLSPLAVAFILLLFVGLYSLSRKGLSNLASSILIVLYLLPTLYGFYKWGADLPQGLLACALAIVMAGILVGTRWAFIVTTFLSIYLVTITYLQISGILKINTLWKTNILTIDDSIVSVGTILVIFVISCLYNQQIEKSIKQIIFSENELKKERDLLEVRVEERTKELKEAQIETMTQIFRFAEFGKLASGIFHDLINPITSVSLNLSQINPQGLKKMSSAKGYLQEALHASKRMENFMIAIRKQLQHQDITRNFSLNEEIEQSVQVLAYRSRLANVEIKIATNEPVTIKGNPLRFNQVITCLLSNAIDAYKNKTEESKRGVVVAVNRNKKNIIVSIQDWGVGIERVNLKKVFEPFFTTKTPEEGMGIGLSIARGIVEHDFAGKIWAESSPDKGTIFYIRLTAPSIIPSKRNAKEGAKAA